MILKTIRFTLFCVMLAAVGTGMTYAAEAKTKNPVGTFHGASPETGSLWIDDYRYTYDAALKIHAGGSNFGSVKSLRTGSRVEYTTRVPKQGGLVVTEIWVVQDR